MHESLISLLLYEASGLRGISNIKLKYSLFPLYYSFKRDDPSMYGSYKTFLSHLKNAQDFGLLPADMRQKVNSVAANLNLPVVEALQKVFLENDAVFCKKCITKYGPNLKRKLEEHPGIQVIEKCNFTIF